MIEVEVIPAIHWKYQSVGYPRFDEQERVRFTIYHHSINKNHLDRMIKIYPYTKLLDTHTLQVEVFPEKKEECFNMLNEWYN